MANTSDLIKRLDWVFSRWLRKSNADEDGMVVCFTCGHLFHWLSITCGHFRKRRHMATRWNEINCAPQCVECNNKDDEKLFGNLIDERWGLGIAQMLTELSLDETKLSKDELIEKIKEYENKIALCG